MTADKKVEIPFLDLAAMQRDVGDGLTKAWQSVTADARYIGGPVVELFEHEWADYCGTTQAVGVANGTDALELVLTALGIGQGDEVIVPSNTFIATAEAVVAVGATPFFVDVDAETLLITPETVADAIGPRTAAVIVVHLFGQMADMSRLTRVAERAGIHLLEDAAQAHGAKWDDITAGSHGVAGCFSFYPGKNLGAFGDGGAITTSDATLADQIRSIADHGRSRSSKYTHPRIGRNSRLDALQAAVLSAKLPFLDIWNASRRRVAATYRSHLRGSGARLVGQDSRSESVHHVEVVRVYERDRLAAHLNREGIATGIHYPVPCHQQKPYADYPRGDMAVVERAANEILSLPMYPHLSDEAVTVICDTIRTSL